MLLILAFGSMLRGADCQDRITKLPADRKAIRDQIGQVSRRRDEYITAEKKKHSGTARNDSFNDQVSTVINEEVNRKTK